jgi:hypothetical protein
VSLFAALLLVQAAPPPPEAAPTAEEVVVTANRLRRLRMVTRRDKRTGAMRCVFKRSSGSAALDAEVCAAVLACHPKARTLAEMRACLAPVMDGIAARVGAPWRATRGF